MSYEKLKVLVASALIAFIFIVGSIVTLGSLQGAHVSRRVKTKKPIKSADTNAIVSDNKKNTAGASPGTALTKTGESQNKAPQPKPSGATSAGGMKNSQDSAQTRQGSTNKENRIDRRLSQPDRTTRITSRPRIIRRRVYRRRTRAS